MGRVGVVGVCRVDAHGCSSGCVVLHDGVLYCGNGGGLCHRHRRLLLDVDLLHGGGRWLGGEVVGVGSSGCCCSRRRRGKVLHLLGEQLLLYVLLGCLLQLTVLLHLFLSEGDRVTLQRSQAIILSIHALFLKTGWGVSRVGMHGRLLLHVGHE
jgi:hypothetical protein